MENRVYSVASKVYELLEDGAAREIDGFDNSYGEMIDKRFEPQIKYLGKRAILAVTYFIDYGIIT